MGAINSQRFGAGPCSEKKNLCHLKRREKTIEKYNFQKINQYVNQRCRCMY